MYLKHKEFIILTTPLDIISAFLVVTEILSYENLKIVFHFSYELGNHILCGCWIGASFRTVDRSILQGCWIRASYVDVG